MLLIPVIGRIDKKINFEKNLFLCISVETTIINNMGCFSKTSSCGSQTYAVTVGAVTTSDVTEAYRFWLPNTPLWHSHRLQGITEGQQVCNKWAVWKGLKKLRFPLALCYFWQHGSALLWELSDLPCVYMERLRQEEKHQIPSGYRREQASMTTEMTLI